MKTTIKIDRRYRMDKVAPKSLQGHVGMSWVLVKGGKAYATNGRTLACVPVQREGDQDDVTVGRDAWAELVRTKTTHTHLGLRVSGDEDRVFGGGLRIMSWEHSDMRDQWPCASDPGRVLPEDAALEGGVRLGINVKLLAELAQALGAEEDVVFLTIPPASLETETGGVVVGSAIRVQVGPDPALDDSRAVGAIMPVVPS